MHLNTNVTKEDDNNPARKRPASMRKESPLTAAGFFVSDPVLAMGESQRMYVAQLQEFYHGDGSLMYSVWVDCGSGEGIRETITDFYEDPNLPAMVERCYHHEPCKLPIIEVEGGMVQEVYNLADYEIRDLDVEDYEEEEV